ncbi:hypothetical protein WME73_18420 [Sorangium sp. So ce302]|uniref:5'-methylthioadenosine/S-adenosylhomocysteine nucleosidase family protein n=1 Tax=Sorangium sp. So ce302 TaxID=3133297 RepID=UPI003F5EC1C8
MAEENAFVERIDVLIVTAVKDEWDAVLAVDTGAVQGSTWERRGPLNRPEVRARSFTVDGGELRLAVVQAYGMGGVGAVSAASWLLDGLNVRCLAMCGVCAGRRGYVELGDVIIADRMWTYDTGKLKVEIVEGQRVEQQKGDIEMYRLHPPDWKHKAERFVYDPEASWLSLRPRSYEAQGDWVLERLVAGADPISDPERDAKCADFERVVEQLWKKSLLKDGTLTLTDAGEKHVRRKLILGRGKLPDCRPFKVHVGPVASGSEVVEDPDIFERLSTPMRKVLGLEMEIAAIGTLGYERQLEGVVAMKGVMDHADSDKSDNMKAFAARASAECLIAFLRANLPPRGANAALDRLLIPGTSEPPAEPSPAALLSARHQIVPFFGRAALLEEIRAWCVTEPTGLWHRAPPR